jgi:hypothetical protein
MVKMNFLRNWLNEKSTWAGIFLLISAFNIYEFTPEQQIAITTVGISLCVYREKGGGNVR